MSTSVKYGDTLSGIAEKMLGSQARYRDIYEANRDRMTSPDRLDVGKPLRIPRIAANAPEGLLNAHDRDESEGKSRSSEWERQAGSGSVLARPFRPPEFGPVLKTIALGGVPHRHHKARAGSECRGDEQHARIQIQAVPPWPAVLAEQH